MKKILVFIAPLLSAVFLLTAVNAFGGSVLTVNDSSSGITCNQTLSLEEAATFARDGSAMRNLTDGEKAQISGATWVRFPPGLTCTAGIWRAAVNGNVGSGYADDIVFSNLVGVINGAALLGRNDDIDGLKPNGTKVILDGTGLGGLWSGVVSSDPSREPTGSQIRNLEIRNFSNCGVNVATVDGMIIEGLDVHDNAQCGILVDVKLNVALNNRNLRIGGNEPQQRNLIYRNGGVGIMLDGYGNSDRFPNQNIRVLNNYIGTRDGVTDDGNASHGIYVRNQFGVTIGDPDGLTRNVISGNGGDGIRIATPKSVSNEVIYNFIGTDASGGGALGNSGSGVAFVEGAGSSADFVTSGANIVGRTARGNVISGNNIGVSLTDTETANNWIQSNLIGTNVGGTSDLGNVLDGVFIGVGTTNNRIGGVNSGEGNLIAFNRRGIYASGGNQTYFRRNRIFSNDQLGIDLDPVGVTPNDAGDGDGGPNELQNSPIITYVIAQSSSSRVEGTLNSVPNRDYVIEFFGNTSVDPSGSGEGRNFLGETTVTTDGSGNATFNVVLNTAIANVGSWISATATDPSGNTSEYSTSRNICADVRFSPISLQTGFAATTSSFAVVNSNGCSFSAAGNAAWLSVTSAVAGTVNFSVAANAGAARSGGIVVTYNNGTASTTATFPVTQAANNCTIALTPSTGTSVPQAGGSTSFTVSTAAGCQWTATPLTNWTTITSGTSGTGNGTVSVSVTANTGGLGRSGQISVNGTIFVISQIGCTYLLSRSTVNFGLGANSFGIGVGATGTGCQWSATTINDWITIDGNPNRTGNGEITFRVSDAGATARSGIIFVAGQSVTINQSSNCVYQTSPRKRTMPLAGGTSTFSVTAPTGCAWRIDPNPAYFINASTFAGTGNGTIQFAIQPMAPGGFRYVSWRIDSELLAVEQTTSCSYGFNIDTLRLPVNGGDRIASVATQSGCSWNVVSDSNWLTVTTSASNTGSQNVGLAVARNTTRTNRVGTISIVEGTTVRATLTVRQSGSLPIYDFDGDGKTDVSIFRPSNGSWWYRRSTDDITAVYTFGDSTSKLVAGDFTGDGITDITVWSPSTGIWSVFRSDNLTFFSFPFGTTGDIPVAADFDGDGIADPTVYRPSSGTWYTSRSSDGGTTITNFGIGGDKPIPADYDGDGKADIAVFRPSDGSWWYVRSIDGQFRVYRFGVSTDRPVPADFSGDGTTDIAVFRPSTGEWFVQRSEDNSYFSFPFGAVGDIPVPGDYDNDGRADPAVFRPSTTTWFINRTQSGIAILNFGSATDIPVPSSYFQ